MMMTMTTTMLMMALMMIYDGNAHDEKQGGTGRLVIGDSHFNRALHCHRGKSFILSRQQLFLLRKPKFLWMCKKLD